MSSWSVVFYTTSCLGTNFTIIVDLLFEPNPQFAYWNRSIFLITKRTGGIYRFRFVKAHIEINVCVHWWRFTWILDLPLTFFLQTVGFLLCCPTSWGLIRILLGFSSITVLHLILISKAGQYHILSSFSFASPFLHFWYGSYVFEWCKDWRLGLIRHISRSCFTAVERQGNCWRNLFTYLSICKPVYSS